MVDESERLEKVLQISQSCLVPALIQDLDTSAISSSDFDEYRLISNDQLHLFLDILYQNSYLLKDKAFDKQTIQLRVNLLLIASQQLEPNPFYHSEDKMLLASLRQITFNHIDKFEDDIYERTINIYKKGLTKDKWKKNIGHTHAYPFFCEILLKHKSKLANDDFLMFSLSVGSNLIAHYDPHYRTIGFKVYRILLELCDEKLIKKLNIHSVIFNEAFPMIQRSSESDYNEHLYESLYRVIKIESKSSTVFNSNWSKFDDMMSKLITQFSTESDKNLCNKLLYILLKFCAIDYDCQLKPENDFANLSAEHFEELRQNFSMKNIRTMRWVKKLMEMIIRESTKLFNDETSFTLNCFHCIYILSMLNLNSNDFKSQLDNFVRKFVMVLMQVVRQKRERSESIENFLLSVEFHVNCDDEMSVAIKSIREEVNKLKN